ncbi:6587_t:CDS:2 [Scutellospora calospora]|uniref:6587_t:CDS:1 n=1 Tax=Scutellospora calospora TaxID=85575 RepID=A0ACA9K272_9GLOM|nr:6587_t:CDS:2 [Scutellospora calospora]
MSQQLIAEITRISKIVTKLKGEKNDAQVKYDEIIKKFNNFTTNIQDAISDVLKNMKIDQASKDNIIKKIKEKADDIIGKMPEENDNNNPNIQPELDIFGEINEKIKLQSLRVSKKIYFEFVDDYGKVDRYLQGLIDLREEVNKHKFLVVLHKTQLFNLIDNKIKELKMEEDEDEEI